MSITIKGKLADIIGFVTHLNLRDRIFRKSSHKKMEKPYINKLANEIHPDFQKLEIVDVVKHSDNIKTFRLKKIDKSNVAIFRSGQYLVIESEVNGVKASRPYSISTSPKESQNGGYYEITVKSEPNGFMSKEAVNNWDTGMKIISSQPMGFFHYEPLRDKKNIICFAGGSGITPFRSMIPDLLEKYKDIKITLFFGFTTIGEYLFTEDFNKLLSRYSENFTMVPVLSENDSSWEGKTGFITENLIKEFVPDYCDCSWFICGPQGLKDAISSIFQANKLRKANLRSESFTPVREDSNTEVKNVSITVYNEGEKSVVKGATNKTIVYSLERSGLNPPAYCRSGECGWCRSKLLSGKVDNPSKISGVRISDKDFDYIHPCSSYPTEDIEIEVSANPLDNVKL